MKVLVAGASGFVGRRLCAALDQAGHDVVAMTRNPARYRGAGSPVRGDVHDPATLEPAMAGCQAAYYLVHSLQDADFEDKDATGATAFGEAAARAGLHRIIYLGGLGDDADNLSAHLRSRREVENLCYGTGWEVEYPRDTWRLRNLGITVKGGPAHEVFLNKHLGESPEDFRAQWRKAVFTGQGAMPKAFGSESAVLEYVAVTPGAVGYVTRVSPQDHVKSLLTVK